MISFKRRRRPAHNDMPEICLTPLIDTALTLLVIFMVTAPLIQNSIKIDLPDGNAQEAGNQSQQELVVAIDKDEQLFLNNKPTSLEQLVTDLKKQLASSGPKQRVWITVDKNKTCSAGKLISVIDTIKVLGGVKDVAIATKKTATRLA